MGEVDERDFLHRRERHGDPFECAWFDRAEQMGEEIPIAALPQEIPGKVVVGTAPIAGGRRFPAGPAASAGSARDSVSRLFPLFARRFGAFEAPRHLEPVPYSPLTRSAPRRERAIRPGLTPPEARLRKRCNVCAPNLRPSMVGLRQTSPRGPQSRLTSGSFFGCKLARGLRPTCGPRVETIDCIRNVFFEFS
jgi:hypothetical protein